MQLLVAEGFLFSPDLSRVVMIRKERPAYLKGKLVGVGGKLEPGESPVQAMQREFWEETGVHHNIWIPILSYVGDLNQIIHVFMGTGDVDAVKTTTDEQVVIVPVAVLPPETNRTCRWSIPMCLDEILVCGDRSIQFAEGIGGTCRK